MSIEGMKKGNATSATESLSGHLARRADVAGLITALDRINRINRMRTEEGNRGTADIR